MFIICTEFSAYGERMRIQCMWLTPAQIDCSTEAYKRNVLGESERACRNHQTQSINYLTY